MNFIKKSIRRKDSKSTVPDIPTALTISDAGKFAYSAICALSLHELFNTEVDKNYIENLNVNFVKHLELPDQVLETMTVLMSGEYSQTYLPYVELLLSEESIKLNHISLIQDFVIFCVKSGNYDSRSRTLLIHISALFGAPKNLAEIAEEQLGHCLLTAAKKLPELTQEQEIEAARQQRKRRLKKTIIVTIAAVGGGALLGVTGGLAAPVIGAGLGVLFGGGLGLAAALGTAAGAAIVGSLFGLAGAGLTGYRMNRRVGDIEEFEFNLLTATEEEQLHIVIAISGWLNTSDANFCYPWRTLRASKEQYYLRYESTYLRELGNAFNLLVSAAVSAAAQEILKQTVLNTLLGAIAWPSVLVTLSSVIDNPWSTCLKRSAQVGRHLAEVLLSRAHGERPVTLVGFSLGARVIFYCLRELADRSPGTEGIIHNAIMLGTPVTGNTKDWEDICNVVGGNVINGYCSNDWMLRFLYRTTNAAITIAGLSELQCSHGRLKNIDLTNYVNGHLDYATNIDTILKVVGLKTEVDTELILNKSNSDTELLNEGTNNNSVIQSSKSLPTITENKDKDEFNA